MALPSRRAARTSDIWVGFVDALAALLMVIIFLLVAFMLADFFLRYTLTGQNQALGQLQRQVNELAEQLSLEREANADLRLSMAQLSAELQRSTEERDELSAQLANLFGERETLTLRLQTLEEEIATLTERAEGAEAAAADTKTRLDQALTEIEVGEDTLKIRLIEIERLRRDITALKQVRAELEAQVSQMAASLAESQDKTARLEKDFTALRDSSAELETRVAEEEERTALAQTQLEEREIQLAEVVNLLEQSDRDLTEERKISSEAERQLELLNRQIAALRQQLAALNAALEAAEAKDEEQKVIIADLGQRLNIALAGKVEELERYRSEFFGRLREVLGDRPDIRVVGDRFVFQSEVLFASGSAELEEPGMIQLAALAATLLEIAQEIPADLPWTLRVDGHTDRRPIQTFQFPSNWELSTARAISVVRFLIDHGVPPERLAATGFGAFQPLDARDDEIAFRRNRRIELKLTQR
ncbi:MAG: peptidoglycan -binding protein [Alphaproteobacteria bacterium]